MRTGKTDGKTYEKIHAYLAFKYGTTAKIIFHVRTWYGMGKDKNQMVHEALAMMMNARNSAKENYYQALSEFVSRRTDEEIKDINKYWARFNAQLLL